MMLHAASLVGALGAGFLLACAMPVRSAAPATCGEAAITVEAHFSPPVGNDIGCTAAMVNEISAAKRAVLVEAYSFTSPAIIEALKAAKARGVDVELVLDRSDDEKEPAEEMKAAGADVRVDRHHKIAHSKVLIIDGTVVVNGSFNMTVSAQKANREDCTVIRSAAVAGVFLSDWAIHQKHAELMR